MESRIKPGRVLKSLELKGFQSHKHTQIEFARQGCLTVITGPSDSGKSAIIRALKLLFYNSPQGDSFITVGEDSCSVEAAYEDGTTVARVRSRGGVNRYKAGGHTFKYFGVPKIFEGFGVRVPLEVQQATGIRKLAIGDQSYLLNLSEQLAGPFLGNDTPAPARAKVLGKLAGTEEIDFAGKETGTDIFRGKRKKEELETGIAITQKELDGFAWIPGREMQLTEVERLVESVKRSQKQVAELKGLNNQLTGLDENISAIQDKLGRLQLVNEGMVSVRRVEIEFAKHGKVALLNQSYIDSWPRIADMNTIIHRLVGLEWAMESTTMAEDRLIFKNQLSTAESEVQRFLRQITLYQSCINTLSLQYAMGEHVNYALKDVVKSDELDQLMDEYEGSYHRTLSLRRVVQNTEWMDEALGLVAALPEKMEKVKSLKAELTKSDSFSVTIKKYSEQAHWSKTEAVQLEREYIRLMTELGKCPTCGGDIHIEKLKGVV